MKNHASRTSITSAASLASLRAVTAPRTLAGARKSPLSRSTARPGLCLALGALALGCAREGVDLGGETLAQDLQRGSRCVASTAVTENVVVSQQEDLDALAGCEEIHGHLIVRAFAGADLAPLGSLRSVDGHFALGVQENWDEIFGFAISERLDQQVELLRTGWVASLDGVQALEHAGAMFLRGLPDADFTAFESLASVGGGGGALSGLVIVQQNLKLTSLRGLETLTGMQTFVGTLNPELTGVDVLATSSLRGVSLYSSRALAHLSALSAVTNLEHITLFDIGVTELSALAGLQSVESLGVSENSALVDASGLTSLESADSITIGNNAVLAVLPSFENFTLQPSTLAIVENPALESVVLDFTNAPTRVYDIAGFVGEPEVDAYELGVDVIHIRRNGKLSSLSVPAGLTKANLMLVGENPSLASVDFGSLRELGQLSVTENATLAEVDPGELRQVSSLEVVDNPLLSPAVFDGVQTFAREIHGNAE